jgi:pimeloyl-ACP methyl ester carboxylesterase
MKKIAVNGVELAYRDEGDGDPIVFLHAFPLNQTMWDEQLGLFRAGHRVITFDWRGFGGSTTGSDKSSMSVFADDLAGLLDGLGIEQTVVCGLSMGGYAAFAFYRKYAARVSRLILADTRATQDAVEARKARHEMAALARTSGPSALTDTMIPRLLGDTTLQNKPETVERIRGLIESNSGDGIAKALIGMAERDDSTDLLSIIDCSTLVIAGSEDKLTLPGEMENMSRAIKTADFQVVSGAGHLPNIEQPVEFNRVIGNFLNDPE